MRWLEVGPAALVPSANLRSSASGVTAAWRLEGDTTRATWELPTPLQLPPDTVEAHLSAHVRVDAPRCLDLQIGVAADGITDHHVAARTWTGLATHVAHTALPERLLDQPMLLSVELQAFAPATCKLTDTVLRVGVEGLRVDITRPPARAR